MRVALIGLIGCLGIGANPVFAENQCETTNPAENTWNRYEFRQPQMGVLFGITLYAPDKSTANNAATAAFARIGQLNRVMSDYDPDSELMRLCRNSADGNPIQVSRDLLVVLQRAQSLSCQTDGAFDVTVGPIVKLWRRARRRRMLPKPERLDAARQLVGFRNVAIDRCTHTVELQQSGMKLDLGGIAKGYAADAALAALRKFGITRALIDASGDIVVGDPPPGKTGWKVEVGPLAKDKQSQQPPTILVLANAAVATSGDAFQYVEIDGVRYSHIVDPHTGMGLTTRSSVTVIAPNATDADSLASAVSVLGPRRGLKLINATNRTEARVSVIEQGRLKSYSSHCFHQAIVTVNPMRP